MSALAKPFDYTSFDPAEPAPAEPQERTYSQAELEEAVAAARKQALETARSEEATRQTLALTDIATALSDEIEKARDERNIQIDYLTEIAERLVTQCCLNAITNIQKETALGLVKKHLTAEATVMRAVLYVSVKTTARTKNNIKQAIADIDPEHAISIETDQTLRPGEIRLAWRGGELARLDETMKTQITEIFASAKHAPATRQKGPSS